MARLTDIKITLDTTKFKKQVEEAKKDIEALADNSLASIMAKYLLPKILGMVVLGHVIFWVAFCAGLLLMQYMGF